MQGRYYPKNILQAEEKYAFDQGKELREEPFIRKIVEQIGNMCPLAVLSASQIYLGHHLYISHKMFFGRRCH